MDKIKEFAEQIKQGLHEELDSIIEEQNRKGKLSGFDQGRSFEIGVCEALIAKALVDLKKEK